MKLLERLGQMITVVEGLPENTAYLVNANVLYKPSGDNFVLYCPKCLLGIAVNELPKLKAGRALCPGCSNLLFAIIKVRGGID